MKIEYKSENGYRGVLYGKSSMAIYDAEGVERMHTGFRAIDTLEELKREVDGFPLLLKALEEHRKWI